MAELDAAAAADFCAALEGVWEHSPWVAEAVVNARPFATREELATAMAAAVNSADPARQLELVRAHPDLAGKFGVAGELTPESASEQASAGLDQLTAQEYRSFDLWNERYRQRFGIPFVICVRNHTKTSIRAALRERLQNVPSQEHRTALAEVRKIAEYRLFDRIRP